MNIECPKCGQSMVEEMLDDYFGQAPYTNILKCVMCNYTMPVADYKGEQNE